MKTLYFSLIFFAFFAGNSKAFIKISDFFFSPDNTFEEFFVEYDLLFADTEGSVALNQYKRSYQKAFNLLVEKYIYEIDPNRKSEIINFSINSLKRAKEDLKGDDFNPENVMHYVMADTFSAIDAHTLWLNPYDAEQFLNSLSGNFSGIGIIFNYDKDKNAIRVIRVFDKGPANLAGILPEDYIYMIDGEVLDTDVKLTTIVEKIKGEEGTKVRLGVLRDNKKLEFNVTRGSFYVPSVEYKIIDDKYGVITINSFNQDSASLFRKALIAMNINELNGLIIDVRNNGGGLLPSVVYIADTILGGEIITSIKGRDPATDQNFYSFEQKFVNDNIPIIVLTNFMSASASELLAGALRINNRATLIGTTTFGKWSVQSSISMDDNSIFNITTQLFYAPNNKTYQTIGIMPDIFVYDNFKDKETREKDVPYALQVEGLEPLKSKLTINQEQCLPIKEDYILGCAVTFLDSYEDFNVFEKKLVQ